jgi:uncharacterized protein
MSEENVQIVRELAEAWNRGDVEAFLATFASDCEVIFPPDVPEPGPFHGQAELRGWIDGFLAAWDHHHADVVDPTSAGDEVVVALHMTGRGKGSGIAMDETDWHVFTIQDGKVARWRNFNDRDEALEAAGLWE